MAYQVEIRSNVKCFNFKSSYKKNLTFNKLKFHGPYKANRKKIYRDTQRHLQHLFTPARFNVSEYTRQHQVLTPMRVPNRNYDNTDRPWKSGRFKDILFFVCWPLCCDRLYQFKLMIRSGSLWMISQHWRKPCATTNLNKFNLKNLIKPNLSLI